jgi:hypothetical protein
MSDVKKVTVETENIDEILTHEENDTSTFSQDEEANISISDYVEVSIDPDNDNVSVEDLDSDEEIWPGGPTAGMIIDWKQEYGDVYVTSVTYDNHIVWRVLNRLEYKNIVKHMESLVQDGQMTSAEANMWNEEAIAEVCVLYPKISSKDLTGAMAGVPSLIAQEVLEASGFVALEVRQL